MQNGWMVVIVNDMLTIRPSTLKGDDAPPAPAATPVPAAVAAAPAAVPLVMLGAGGSAGPAGVPGRLDETFGLQFPPELSFLINSQKVTASNAVQQEALLRFMGVLQVRD
jgi:hypothetical protein